MEGGRDDEYVKKFLNYFFHLFFVDYRKTPQMIKTNISRLPGNNGKKWNKKRFPTSVCVYSLVQIWKKRNS